MLDKAANMLDFNLLELCLKGPESELERLDSIRGLPGNSIGGRFFLFFSPVLFCFLFLFSGKQRRKE